MFEQMEREAKERDAKERLMSGKQELPAQETRLNDEDEKEDDEPPKQMVFFSEGNSEKAATFHERIESEQLKTEKKDILAMIVAMLQLLLPWILALVLLFAAIIYLLTHTFFQ